MLASVKSLIRRAFFYFLESTAALSLKPASKHEARLIAELRETIDSLPPLPEQTSENTAWWLHSRRELRNYISSHDPRRFLRWGNIIMNMFPAYNPYLKKEYAEVKAQPDFELRWKPAITENSIGGPLRFPHDHSTSGSAINSAYHLITFSQFSQLDIANFDSIIEFGGGYGRLCQMAYMLGFKGQYTIFDLPEVSAIQRYYLKSQGILTANCVSDLSQVQPLSEGRQLFIALWSFSETPVDFRKTIEPVIDKCNAVLIGYNELPELDNVNYFEQLRQRLNHTRTTDFPIAHLGAGNRYYFSVS
ncbi:MAG: putative sugar O-methyltransferase [Pseudomonadales bacterium]|nr:putative sugar O-methyltransferase [Pseudomonadales bacterium]